MSARLALTALVLAVLSCHVAAAQPSAEASLYIGRVEGVLRALYRDPDRRTRCTGFVDDALDVRRLAQSVAADLGDRLPSRLHPAFESSVRARLSRECVRLVEEHQGAALEIVAAPRPERVTTRTTAPSGGARIVRWRLVPGGPWGRRAVDIDSDGRSLAGTILSEAEAALAANGGDADAMIRAVRR